MTCKICLAEENLEEDFENPMINLCKCTGSISDVHYHCLKMWMQTKLNTKTNDKKNITSYNMKSFNCEICKTPYPRKIIDLIFISSFSV
jgi:E3 ubiquitin-protein ligase DOA10